MDVPGARHDAACRDVLVLSLIAEGQIEVDSDFLFFTWLTWLVPTLYRRLVQLVVAKSSSITELLDLELVECAINHTQRHLK